MTKRNTSNYPIELITSYRAGKISRQQFQQKFSDWQKSRGINYDCKGTADRSGVYITYRGIKAAIRNGLLCWKNNTAKTVFEFRRKVDFALNAEAQALYNACYFTDKSYNASRDNNYEDREKYKQAADFYIKQAEKLGALWI